MAVCFCALFASPAQATLITIAIEAEIDYVSDPHNFFGGNINVGDIIKGSYSFESTTPDSSPIDPIQGNYWHYAPPAGIELNIDGFNFMTDPFNTAFRIVIRNNTPSGNDIYGFESSNNLPLSNGTQVDYISWSLKDNTGSAVSSDALPTAFPFLGDWQENRLLISGPDRDASFSINAHVTSAIPEPTMIILIGLGSLFLKKRKRL